MKGRGKRKNGYHTNEYQWKCITEIPFEKIIVMAVRGLDVLKEKMYTDERKGCPGEAAAKTVNLTFPMVPCN